MKRFVWTVAGALLSGAVWAQDGPVTITSQDMFNEAGLYYRAYAHEGNASSLTPRLYMVNNRMGSAGADQIWDFRTGPTDQILRYDYLSAASVPEAVDFSLATLVERETVEGGGNTAWLMFEPVPGLGRRVHGARTEVVLLGMQPLLFTPPPVDFPDTINYGDTWNNDFSFEALDVMGEDPDDPGFYYTFGIRQTYSQRFTVDAWGTVLLPQIGPVDALRINGEQTVDSEYYDDFISQGWEYVGTDFARVYYWLSPTYGIVAQLQSKNYTSPAAEQFAEAIGFIRMFETNKKPGSGSTDPQPVTGLDVVVGNGIVVVQWNRAINTSRYRVEYSTGGLGPDDWQPLAEETQNTSVRDPAGLTGSQRFYRVVSLR